MFFPRVISVFHCSRMVVSDDGGLEIDMFQFMDIEGKAIDQPGLARMP